METSHIVRSPLPDIEVPNITLYELAFSKFQTFGSKIALVSISQITCSQIKPKYLFHCSLIFCFVVDALDCIFFNTKVSIGGQFLLQNEKNLALTLPGTPTTPPAPMITMY